MSKAIKLMVGLGNPGPQYESTRHNAGVWYLERMAECENIEFKPEKKFHGLYAKLPKHDCHLLIPTTFMNNSGQAVGALAKYFKLAPEEILIAHDELDLPCGIAKLKTDGGHGGHNGLRDIMAHLGSKEFLRLRIGIDRPNKNQQGIDYVLSRPSKTQRDEIDTAIDAAMAVSLFLFEGKVQQAMMALHTT